MKKRIVSHDYLAECMINNFRLYLENPETGNREKNTNEAYVDNILKLFKSNDLDYKDLMNSAHRILAEYDNGQRKPDHTTQTALKHFVKMLGENNGIVSCHFLQPTPASFLGFSPIVPPLVGPDSDTTHIHYAKDISNDEKVPGLCGFLEDHYDSIIGLARELLSNVFDNGFNKKEIFRPINVILTKNTPTKKYRISDKELAERLFKLLREKSGVTVSEILEIIQKANFTERLGGMYHANDRTIEIYYKNINADDGPRYKLIALMILAHEYLHYLHHVMVGDAEFTRQDHEAKAVKEALADFFSFRFLFGKHEQLNSMINYVVHTYPPNSDIRLKAENLLIIKEHLFDLAHKRFDLWNNRADTSWPYAYARFFVPSFDEFWFDDHKRNRSLSLFKEVFSIKNLDDAYQALITLKP